MADSVAIGEVLQQTQLPHTFGRLQRACDMMELCLKASAFELSLVLQECKEQQMFLVHIDKQIQLLDEEVNMGEGKGDDGKEGEQSEDDAGGDGSLTSSTVAGLGTVGTQGGAEEEYVDEMLE